MEAMTALPYCLVARIEPGRESELVGHSALIAT